MVSYIDYIIRHNFADFRTVGLHDIEYEAPDGNEKISCKQFFARNYDL